VHWLLESLRLTVVDALMYGKYISVESANETGNVRVRKTRLCALS
jgi:hypothetical protein